MEIGEKVKHYKFGEGVVKRIDNKTYSNTMIIVELTSGGEIIRPEVEWERNGE